MAEKQKEWRKVREIEDRPKNRKERMISEKDPDEISQGN